MSSAIASSLGLSKTEIQQILNTSPKTNHKQDKVTRVTHLVTKKAKQMLRVPYHWGGTSPQGFDCSGLVQYAYKKAGINLPRTAAEQYKATRRIKQKHTVRGDLVFFHTRRSRKRVNHVGIYLGDGHFIHAPGRGKRVKISRLSKYWKKKMVGIGRTM